MANNTWKILTNNILRQSGLSEILTDDAFNNPQQGLMTRYQSCAREFIRITHEMVSVDLPVNFARREITLPIDNLSGPVYSLNSAISVESITYDSFRNVSASPPGPGVLRNWTYEYFTKRYPDLAQIYTAAPTHYIFLPVDIANQSPVYKVRFFPNPDQAYTIKYIAQLNAYQLTDANSPVLWPPEYEHVLETQARFQLEDLLGEGKSGSLSLQANRLYAKMRQKATPSRAERKSVRMKRLYTGRGTFGYYDSPPDDDAPYSTPSGIR